MRAAIRSEALVMLRISVRLETLTGEHRWNCVRRVDTQGTTGQTKFNEDTDRGLSVGNLSCFCEDRIQSIPDLGSRVVEPGIPHRLGTSIGPRLGSYCQSCLIARA